MPSFDEAFSARGNPALMTPAPGSGTPEGVGTMGGKNGWMDIGDRHKLGPILFPGTAIAGRLVNPNEVQKKVMDDKYKGIPDYNPYDAEQREYYQQYDNHPEVKRRRWEQMPWDAKLLNLDHLNHNLQWMVNAGVMLGLARTVSASWRVGFQLAGITYFGFWLSAQGITLS